MKEQIIKKANKAKEHIWNVTSKYILSKKTAPIAIISGSILIYLALMNSKKEIKVKPLEDKTISAKVIKIKYQDNKVEIKSGGIINPKNKTTIIAEVSGRVTEISDRFNAGYINDKGEKIAQIERTMYVNELIKSESNLAMAEADLMLEQAKSKAAKAEWKDVKELEPSKLGLRIPQLKKFSKKVEYAQAMVLLAKQNLDRTTIITPYKSLIINRSINIGGYINKGTKIGEVVDTSVGQIRLPINLNKLNILKSSTTKNFKISLYKEINNKVITWDADFIHSEKIINKNNRMIYIIGEVKNPYDNKNKKSEHRLTFGEFVKAKIKDITIEKAAKIPNSAVKENKHNEKIVFVVNDKNILEERKVNIAMHHKNYYYIKDGLKTNDIIVLNAKSLSAGHRIKPNVITEEQEPEQ